MLTSYTCFAHSSDLSHNLFWGSIPDAVANATNLKQLVLSDNLITSLPGSVLAKIPPTVTELHLDANLLACIPSFAEIQVLLTRGVSISLEDNLLDWSNTSKCPNLAGILQNGGFNSTKISLLPATYIRDSYRAPESGFDFIVNSSKLVAAAVRVKGNILYFFGVDNRTNTVYTTEYFGVQIPAVHIVASRKTSSSSTESFIVSTYELNRYSSGVLSSDGGKYTLTSFLRPNNPGNESVVELILDFTQVPGSVKYSFRMTKWLWPAPIYTVNGTQYEFKILPQFQLLARTPHTSLDSALLCSDSQSTEPLAVPRIACDSRHLEYSIFPDFLQQLGVLSFTSRTGRLSVLYTFQISYKVDGADDLLTPRNPSSILAPISVFGRTVGNYAFDVPGSPVKSRFLQYQAENSDVYADQTIVYLLPVLMGHFSREILIDPTVTLSLAFDSAAEVSSPAESLQVNLAAIIAPTVVIAVVLVVAIVIVAVPAARYRVFPFLKARQIRRKDPHDLAPDDSEISASTPVVPAAAKSWRRADTDKFRD